MLIKQLFKLNRESSCSLVITLVVSHGAIDWPAVVLIQKVWAFKNFSDLHTFSQTHKKKRGERAAPPRKRTKVNALSNLMNLTPSFIRTWPKNISIHSSAA